MAAPVEMLFGLRTRVSPRKHVLDGGPDPPMGKAILRGKGSSHCKLYGYSAVPYAKTAEPIQMLVGLWARMGPRNRVNWGSSSAEGRCHGNQFWD